MARTGPRAIGARCLERRCRDSLMLPFGRTAIEDGFGLSFDLIPEHKQPKAGSPLRAARFR